MKDKGQEALKTVCDSLERINEGLEKILKICVEEKIKRVKYHDSLDLILEDLEKRSK